MEVSIQKHLAFKLLEPVRFLVFSAWLRAHSLNSKLASLAAHMVEKHCGKVDLGKMEEFDVPSYNHDVQEVNGFPPGAEEFYWRMEANDAFILICPEYNASLPGVLKNAIDWVSRYHPFNERHGLLLSASPSMTGGNRGLWSLPILLEHLGARVFPDMFSLAQAHKAFDSDGNIASEQLRLRFERTIQAFMELAEAAKKYPCAEKAWFEYLGEPTETVTARAQ